MSDIIHSNQTGFLHGRYIGDNIRQVLETIEHFEKSGKPGLLFIADFEKAFDKVRLGFIYKCLEHFNFGESLMKWVKIMYSNPRCKIVNNGYFSESFKLSRGVKQGCPLSAYLFIVAIEMLAIKIRSNNNIRGLEIQGLKHRCHCTLMIHVFF